MTPSLSRLNVGPTGNWCSRYARSKTPVGAASRPLCTGATDHHGYRGDRAPALLDVRTAYLGRRGNGPNNEAKDSGTHLPGVQRNGLPGSEAASAARPQDLSS